MEEYIGKHEQESVYDGILAKPIRDRLAEKAKNRKHYNAEMLEKARNMKYRNRSGKTYDDLPKRYRDSKRSVSGIGRCGERREARDCKAYCAMQSHQHRIDINAEKSIIADYNAEMYPEIEHRVGYSTVERIMHHADKRMREIRASVTERRDDDEFVETYDDSYVLFYADGNGFQYPYPDEYYNEKTTWEFYAYMIGKYGMAYANKYAKGEI